MANFPYFIIKSRPLFTVQSPTYPSVKLCEIAKTIMALELRKRLYFHSLLTAPTNALNPSVHNTVSYLLLLFITIYYLFFSLLQSVLPRKNVYKGKKYS